VILCQGGVVPIMGHLCTRRHWFQRLDDSVVVVAVALVVVVVGVVVVITGCRWLAETCKTSRQYDLGCI
jgi:hypothetical protein